MHLQPSLEIFSWHEGLGKWVEIGNSGMFRPEMLEPMGLPPDVRVHGWGLSLERPTMIRCVVWASAAETCQLTYVALTGTVSPIFVICSVTRYRSTRLSAVAQCASSVYFLALQTCSSYAHAWIHHASKSLS